MRKALFWQKLKEYQSSPSHNELIELCANRWTSYLPVVLVISGAKDNEVGFLLRLYSEYQTLFNFVHLPAKIPYTTDEKLAKLLMDIKPDIIVTQFSASIYAGKTDLANEEYLIQQAASAGASVLWIPNLPLPEDGKLGQLIGLYLKRKDTQAQIEQATVQSAAETVSFDYYLGASDRYLPDVLNKALVNQRMDVYNDLLSERVAIALLSVAVKRLGEKGVNWPWSLQTLIGYIHEIGHVFRGDVKFYFANTKEKRIELMRPDEYEAAINELRPGDEIMDSLRDRPLGLSVKHPRHAFRLMNIFGNGRINEDLVQMATYTFLFSHESKGKPSLLVIGDSIRMRFQGTGYIFHLYDLLCDDFHLEHLPVNPGSTRAMENWTLENPDILALNLGLHDLQRTLSNDTLQAYIDNPRDLPNLSKAIPYDCPVDEYRNNMAGIVKGFIKRGSKVVLLSSTPVREEICNAPERLVMRTKRERQAYFRFNMDVELYNQALQDVSSMFGLPYIDLYSCVKPNAETYISETDGVHLSPEGDKYVAQLIGSKLREIERHGRKKHH